MTKLTRILLALAVLLSAGLAACGGDDDDSASAKTNATISSNDAKAAARAAGVDESCVEGVQAYTALAGAAGSAFSGTSDIDKNVKAFKAYADAGPKEIRAELHVLADAYGVYVKAIADSGYSPSSGKPPTPEQAAALSAAGDKISSTDVKTAGDKVSAYFDAHCKRK